MQSDFLPSLYTIILMYARKYVGARLERDWEHDCEVGEGEILVTYFDSKSIDLDAHEI